MSPSPTLIHKLLVLFLACTASLSCAGRVYDTEFDQAFHALKTDAVDIVDAFGVPPQVLKDAGASSAVAAPKEGKTSSYDKKSSSPNQMAKGFQHRIFEGQAMAKDAVFSTLGYDMDSLKTTSARSVIGVAPNDADDDDNLKAAIISSSVTLAIGVLCFSIFHRTYPSVYAYNDSSKGTAPRQTTSLIVTETVDGTSTATTSTLSFQWIITSLTLDLDAVERTRGLDVRMALEFMNLAMWLMAVIAVPTVGVLVPLHFFVGGKKSPQIQDLSTLGLGHIENGSWIYWVHAFMVVAIVWFTNREIYKARDTFFHRRFAWMRNMPMPRANSLQITGIPEEYRSKEALAQYFNRVLGDGKEIVESSCVVLRTRHLLALVETWVDYKQNLMKAQYQWELAGCDESKRPKLGNWGATKGEDTINHFERLCKDAERDANDERDKTLKEYTKFSQAVESHNEQHYQHRETEWSERRSDSAEMEHLEHAKRQRLAAWNRAKADHGYLCTSFGFVTFKTRRDAMIARGLSLTKFSKEFQMSYPPEPDDVIYEDLQGYHHSNFSLSPGGYVSFIILFSLFIPAVSIISSFTDIESMEKNHHWVEHALKDYPWIRPLVEGVLQSLALNIVLSFVPTLICIIFSFFLCQKSRSWGQHHLQKAYFAFLLVFVLLVTMIEKATMGGLIRQAERTMENPALFVKNMASRLPECSHFYLDYMVLQAGSMAIQLCRPAVLTKYLSFRAVFKEKEYVRKLSEPEDQDYFGLGSRSARASLHLTIGLVFCCVDPLITLITFSWALITRITWGHLMVFSETKKPDLGGICWITQINHLQVGLFVFIILMMGVIKAGAALKEECVSATDECASRWNFPFHIVCCCLAYQIWSAYKLSAKHKWKDLPFEEAPRSESLKEARGQQGKEAYGQKELEKDWMEWAQNRVDIGTVSHASMDRIATFFDFLR